LTASLLIANCAHLVIVVLASHRRQTDRWFRRRWGLMRTL